MFTVWRGSYRPRKTSLTALAAAAVATALGVGILIFIWRLAEEPILLGEDAAGASTELSAAVGEPLTFGRFPAVKINTKDGSGTADLSIPVYGSLGNGKLLEWAQQDGGRWHICSLMFRSGDASRVITIVSDEVTHCERE